MDNNIKMNALALNIDDAIIEKLSMIYDPEIGLDIINLGLVYEVNLEENGNCEVVITFTGMGCECIESIPGEIEEVLVELPEIKTIISSFLFHRQLHEFLFDNANDYSPTKCGSSLLLNA